MSSRTIAMIAIIIASLLWSTAGVTAKILLKVFEPFPLAFWRFAFAAIIIIPLLLRQKHLNWKNISKDILPISLLGSANIIFYFFGLQKTTANSAAIIYTAGPLITAILAKILIHEELNIKKITGIVIGLIGVLFIAILPIWERGTLVAGDIFGNLLIITAVLMWAAYTVGSRHLINKKKYSPTTVTSVFIIISAVVFLFIASFTSKQNYVTPLLHLSNLTLLLHLAVLVTVTTYLLYQWAIKHSSATTASLTTYLQPVFGVWLNFIFLGERISIGFILGSLLVLTGVFVATGTQIVKEIRKIINKFISL